MSTTLKYHTELVAMHASDLFSNRGCGLHLNWWWRTEVTYDFVRLVCSVFEQTFKLNIIEAFYLTVVLFEGFPEPFYSISQQA